VKTRFDARAARLRAAALLAAGLMTTGTAWAASAPAGDAAAKGVTLSGAGTQHKVRYGQRMSLSGRAAAGGEVRLEHAPSGRGWRPVASTRSAAGGSYAFSIRAGQSGAYRAVAGGGASPAHRVIVVARLSGKANRHVNIRRAVRVRGALKPGLGGRAVRLQLRSGGRWTTVDRARTGRAGHFSASWKASRAGGYRLRVKFGGDGRNAAVSRTLRGRVYVYRPAAASWYGPGFYGGHTACGYTLNASIKGVANKSLPCGTRVRFRYHGRTTVAKVIDRGPFGGGREWDLTPATKQALGFGDVGTVWSSR
jgi:rare lipoprotein A